MPKTDHHHSGPKPHHIERAAEASRLGLTYELQAKYIGVPPRTYRRWRERGQQESEGPYRDLAAAVELGEGEGAAAAMAQIVKASREGAWQAAAWILERRHGYRRDPPPQIEQTQASRPETPEEVARLVASLGRTVIDAAQRLADDE